jgi:hypothetical protein
MMMIDINTNKSQEKGRRENRGRLNMPGLLLNKFPANYMVKEPYGRTIRWLLMILSHPLSDFLGLVSNVLSQGCDMWIAGG